MNLHYAYIAIFVPLFALVDASKAAQCCYPMKISGEAFFRGISLYKFNVDFERGMVVENWAGRSSFDKVVYDLRNKRKFSLSSSGKCLDTHQEYIGKYERCMPEDTKEIGTDGDVVTYSYMHGDTNILRKLKKDSCLPVQSSTIDGNMELVVDFTTKSGVEHESIFDIDLNHCL